MKRPLQIIHPAQRGVVLVVALIMLLVMTSVGVTLMSGATLQERMAGNARQSASARLNAESALREGERDIQGMNINFLQDVVAQFNSSNADAFYSNKAFLAAGLSQDLIPGDLDLAEPDAWTDADLHTRQLTLNVGGDTQVLARYVIEFMGKKTGSRGDINKWDDGEARSIFVFRITAIGYGQNTNISSILQSIYTTREG